MEYLIKGDVSGIQEFIFNVSSKRAAKALKSRSDYIEVKATEALETLKLKCKDFDLIYNGGGNFFFIADCEFAKQLKTYEKEVNADFCNHGLYLTLSKAEYKENEFKEAWKNVNIQSSFDKMQKFSSNFKGFSGNIVSIFDHSSVKNLPLWNLDLRKENNKITEELYEDDIKAKHRETSDTSIVNLMQMAEFAQRRTGIAKIGILKMDADNMSELFNNVNTTEEAKHKSGLISWFFKKLSDDDVEEPPKEKQHNLYTLINSTKLLTIDINNPIFLSNSMFYNIYPVFSGGDDCFIIGAFDAVARLTSEIHQSFMDYMAACSLNITLSASLQFVEPHYPVIRFAENAEDDLHKAKVQINSSGTAKNAICFLGEVLRWDEFEQVTKLKNNLLEIVEKQGVRSILQRIQESAVEFNILQNQALDGKIELPKIWKLYYYLRNVGDEDVRKKIITDIISVYEEALLEAYSNKISTNPVIFPLAARWTELLTRN